MKDYLIAVVMVLLVVYVIRHEIILNGMLYEKEQPVLAPRLKYVSPDTLNINHDEDVSQPIMQ